MSIVELPVDATIAYPVSVYSGWGPFRAAMIPPPPGNRLEVRVWSPGAGTVNVYRAKLVRVPTGRIAKPLTNSIPPLTASVTRTR